jgi:glutamate synthase (NADPH/NADH) large chain
VGTIAAGVAKAQGRSRDDLRLRRRHRRLALTSIKHAGSPWEIGLAETQQTLVLNRLRSAHRACRSTAGCRPAAMWSIGALLGADEFGFATAPLVVAGLHHDAQVPPEHLPGGRGDPGPGAAQAASLASPST